MPLEIKTDKISVRDGNRFEAVDMLMPNAINEPVQEGTAGQVLTTDGQGGRSWETPQGSVQDVQVNGVSVLQDGVANVPLAKTTTPGVGMVGSTNGIVVDNSGRFRIECAGTTMIKKATGNGSLYQPISAYNAKHGAFYGLAQAAGVNTANDTLPVGQYTESEKSAISEMLNGSVSVSGTTPTINALPGIQYVCGEVATLGITLPASGIVDVVFTSGSTPTVLTITPPTGMTVEWTNDFDSTALEADTMYEINIKMVCTKCLGVAGTWS